MILRKPYAFLIKNFKRIHLVFVALGIFLVYQTNIIYSFFKEVKEVKIVSGKELTDSLFNSSTYVVISILIILIIMVIALLRFKKKKTLLYFLNLFFYIILGLFYYFCYYQVSIMEITAVDIRIILFIYDMLGIFLILQLFSILGFAVRAIGFDIKKFDFGQDIIDLKIDVEDKEEFEVSFDFDVHRINKSLRQKLRFLKYAYIENKIIINLVICLIVFGSALAIILYMDNNRQFKEKKPIQTTNYVMEVEASYVTNKDYESKIIEKGKKFVILKVNVQSRYNREQYLRLGMFELLVDNKKYYPTYDYHQKFIDVGESYYNQIINNEKSTYLVTYLIDQGDAIDKAVLNFYDGIAYGAKGNNNKIYRINLTPKNLDNVITVETANLTESLKISNNFIIAGDLTINDYGVNSRFKNNYQYCLTKTECYSSIEYLTPKYNTNTDKTLLKLNGTWSMYNKITNLTNLAKFLQMYGKISYTINNHTTMVHLNMGQITSLKNNEKDVYYLEIPKEVERAEKITLVIQVRDCLYSYVLKG